MASKPLATPALWARYHGAQLAVEFRESGHAMSLMLGMENTELKAWEGISVNAAEKPIDGISCYVSAPGGLSPCLSSTEMRR